MDNQYEIAIISQEGVKGLHKFDNKDELNLSEKNLMPCMFFESIVDNTVSEVREGGECPISCLEFPEKLILSSGIDAWDALLQLSNILLFHPLKDYDMVVEWLVKYCKGYDHNDDGICESLLRRDYEKSLYIAMNQGRLYLSWILCGYNDDIEKKDCIRSATRMNEMNENVWNIVGENIEAILSNNSKHEFSFMELLLFICSAEIDNDSKINYIWNIIQFQIEKNMNPFERGVLLIFQFHIDDLITIETFLSSMRPVIEELFIEKVDVLLWQWGLGWLLHCFGTVYTSQPILYQRRVTDPLLFKLLNVYKNMYQSQIDESSSSHEIEFILKLMFVIAFYSPFPKHRQMWATRILMTIYDNVNQRHYLLRFLKEVLTNDEALLLRYTKYDQMMFVIRNLFFEQERIISQDMNIPLHVFGIAKWNNIKRYQTDDHLVFLEKLVALSLIFPQIQDYENNETKKDIQIYISGIAIEGYLTFLQRENGMRYRGEGLTHWEFLWSAILAWMRCIITHNGSHYNRYTPNCEYPSWACLLELVQNRTKILDILEQLSHEDLSLNTQEYFLEELDKVCKYLRELILDPRYVKDLLSPIYNHSGIRHPNLIVLKYEMTRHLETTMDVLRGIRLEYGPIS